MHHYSVAVGDGSEGVSGIEDPGRSWVVAGAVVMDEEGTGIGRDFKSCFMVFIFRPRARQRCQNTAMPINSNRPAIAPPTVHEGNHVAEVLIISCALAAALEEFQKIPRVIRFGEAANSANARMTHFHGHVTFL